MSGDWINTLKAKCTAKSQVIVARELRQADGFPSASMINQALHGKYQADKGLQRLQALVEGRYMRATVDCPELGELALDECQAWQSTPLSTANSLRIEMYRACRICPNRRNQK